MTLNFHDLFVGFVVLHILFGSLGLVSFWIPVLGTKGGRLHRQWGRIFSISLLVTGTAAIGISLCTLIDPTGTHPHLEDSEWVRGVFGWMMLGLAVLTVNLAWYGWQCIRNRDDHQANLEWRNLALQVVLLLLSLVGIWQAIRIEEPIILGMPAIGIATVATNLHFLFKRNPQPLDWLKEHIKALIGAGISVYTAFFAFGAVRTFPALALHPGLWAIPLTVGLALIIYHRRGVDQRRLPTA